MAVSELDSETWLGYAEDAREKTPCMSFFLHRSENRIEPVSIIFSYHLLWHECLYPILTSLMLRCGVEVPTTPGGDPVKWVQGPEERRC